MPRDKIDDLVKNEVLRGIVIRAIITLSLFTVISKSVSMTINMPNYNLFEFYGKHAFLWSILAESVISLFCAMLINKYINRFALYDAWRLLIVFDTVYTVSLFIIIFIFQDLIIYITFIFGASLMDGNVMSIYNIKRSVFIADLFKDKPDEHSKFKAVSGVYSDVGYIVGLIIVVISVVVFELTSIQVLYIVVILDAFMVMAEIYTLRKLLPYLLDRRQPTITETLRKLFKRN
jgi:hypothetical protein